MIHKASVASYSARKIAARPPRLLMKALLLVSAVSSLIATASAGERAVLSELSRQTRISVKLLKAFLAHCGTGEESQGAFNLCAHKAALEAEMKMKTALQHASSSLDREQRRSLHKSQQTWLIEAQASCNAAADAEAKGGSMWPMLYYHCIEVEISIRADKLQRWPADDVH